MITVGFTYDLRDDYLTQGFSEEDSAEFDSMQTIACIDSALQANGFAVARIGGIKALVGALSQGQRWDIVFNICEGIKGITRESQIPSLLEAYDLPYVFSSSAVMALTMNKALAKFVVRERDIPTAPFAVIESLADIDHINLPFPMFVKPLAEGTGKGISGKSVVQNKRDLKEISAEIIQKFKQPALAETYLPGKDLTVGILGSGNNAKAIGVMETFYKNGAEMGGQSFYNKKNCEKVLEYALVVDEMSTKAVDIALHSWRTLGCFDGGRVDLRCDKNGVPNFLEVNPLAGLHPTHSDLPILATMTGINHTKLIGIIMDNALKRCSLSQLKSAK